MRSPKNRSLLGVNEDFEGKHNEEIHFLFSFLFLYGLKSTLRHLTNSFTFFVATSFVFKIFIRIFAADIFIYSITYLKLFISC